MFFDLLPQQLQTVGAVQRPCLFVCLCIVSCQALEMDVPNFADEIQVPTRRCHCARDGVQSRLFRAIEATQHANLFVQLDDQLT